MWQRVQTIFLALIVITMLSSNFFPIWIETAPNSSKEILIYNYYAEITDAAGSEKEIYMPYVFLAVLTLLIVIVAGIEISIFKNRLLQMKLGALNSLLMAGYLILGIYLGKNADAIYPSITGDFSNAAYLVVGGMVCNVIANRFIRRDERLVKSMDRMR